MKRRIQTRRQFERVTTVERMKEILEEEWERITVKEIKEIAKLPAIVQRCIAVKGSNNYHA